MDITTFTAHLKVQSHLGGVGMLGSIAWNRFIVYLLCKNYSFYSGEFKEAGGIDRLDEVPLGCEARSAEPGMACDLQTKGYSWETVDENKWAQ